MQLSAKSVGPSAKFPALARAGRIESIDK